jgi:hypothetical protein
MARVVGTAKAVPPCILKRGNRGESLCVSVVHEPKRGSLRHPVLNILNFRARRDTELLTTHDQ